MKPLDIPKLPVFTPFSSVDSLQLATGLGNIAKELAIANTVKIDTLRKYSMPIAFHGIGPFQLHSVNVGITSQLQAFSSLPRLSDVFHGFSVRRTEPNTKHLSKLLEKQR